MTNCLSNFQFSADNGYSTDENITYLEEKGLDGYISTRKLSRKEKNIIYGKNHFKKTISATMQKLKPISALWEKFYIEEEHTNTKTNKE